MTTPAALLHYVKSGALALIVDDVFAVKSLMRPLL